ncbi:BTAD domain-containing putative transcriptional regulator [Kitasatospora sp. MAP5-34]|uniref:AfsR/SARP family transcriptional regulator n=1 Tax=Kitasatospora sp. MAP5-34 TaxID=3035102 RepID=UPI002476BDE0|nr:BTAD domain-containing putative transcriptional regulator [Kitasatospora sp. MAP5-34]MDH6580166.1 DNA-binding SARP family transcriptional activator [Kitasatospora sp. MAP5-34]
MQPPDHAPLPGTVRFAILGPLAVEVDGRPMPLGPPKQRLVLATLLCRPNTRVSVDLLMEAVWPEEPPRTARKNLQLYVWAVRRLLGSAGGDDRLTHTLGGYLLKVAEPELDALRFRALARAGREHAARAAHAEAARLFRQALDLWQSSPLPELPGSELLRAEADLLSERRIAVQEDWAEAELALGNAQEVADTVRELVDRHPLRERLRAAQLTALYRTGRQTEALAAYDGLRQQLARELGLAPSLALQALYRSMLAQQSGPAERRAPGAPPRGLPHTVSADSLPCDTADFTGRIQQVAALVDALHSGGGRTVVAVGPGGTGKTALAVHVAHRLHQEFPDGRVLVALRDERRAARPTAAVLAELARLTGLPGPLPEDIAQAAARWRAWLADRRILLVLDDAPNESAVRPLLPGAGASAALVTSRTPLAGLASVDRLGLPLYSPPEALDLLGRIIGPDRLAGDRAAAERIVAASGLLPLAVRVAGLRLAVLLHLPLREFADRLAEPHAVLDELAAGDLTVRSRLADCWRDLPEQVRTAVLRLCRLPLSRPFTRDDAATALGCDPGRALRRLEALVDTSVVISPSGEVTAHTAQYALPRLLHLYARELAARELAAAQATQEAAVPLLAGASERS